MVDLTKIYKINVIDLPTAIEKGEGLYEVTIADNSQESKHYDVIDLTVLLNKIWKDKATQILDTLQNFRRVFLDLNTGEIIS